MATITLTIGGSLNNSLSVGDETFTCTLASSGGFQSNSGSVVALGEVTAINSSTNTITVDIDPSVVNPGTSDFILFSKDAVVNVSSLTGYFAKVKFNNNAIVPSELFAVSADTHESSK